MKKVVFFALMLAMPLWGLAQEMIERIDIVGNDRVTRDTIMYYLSSREGDYYKVEDLKKDFRVLWSTGFFANVKIDELAGSKGKIIRITVEENPVIRAITYKTGKKVKEDDITAKLKEKDQALLPYSYYSPAKVQQVKKTIEELLSEKGLGAAKVEYEADKKGKSEIELVFKIDEGPKVRVAEVLFVGSPKLSQSTLREALKENKPHALLSWIEGKDAYKQAKIADDLAAVKAALQEDGYMEAVVGEPKVEEVSRRTIWPFSKKRKMVVISIPVEAGFRYKVGEVKVEGNKNFRTQAILDQIKFRKGDIYRASVREKSLEDLGEIFRDFGFLYAQAIPVETLDPKAKVVNVTYQIAEGEMCFLRRLDLKGNIFTKDKVIRREIMLREGDIFRFTMFKDSMLRIKQLGLVDLEKDPEIKPSADDPQQFDVVMSVKELQRNNIQFSAGYSGYEGTFVSASYETVNFLGAGETLNVTAMYGKRTRNYSFGFTEPYLFDRPISAGFNIFDRYLNYYELYNRKGKGVDLTLNARLLGYLRGSITYSYEYVDISVSESYATYKEYLDLYGMGHYIVSSLQPSIYRSTIDSPLTPSSGTLFSASMKYAGTFLGGEIHLIKPSLEFTHNQPIVKGATWQSLGVHLEVSTIKALRGSAVPFWERFFLGGERSIRGYEVYTIGPRSASGTLVGGEKQLVFNAEYVWAIGGPLYLVLFHDRGNAWSHDGKISFKDVFTSTGVEARIFIPALRVPFRLIFSYNNRRIYDSDSNFTFRFAIGTSF
ncbi:MAG: outer membrane protein assembly factor BamA [Candidatus Aminicenantales bacterium]